MKRIIEGPLLQSVCQFLFDGNRAKCASQARSEAGTPPIPARCRGSSLCRGGGTARPFRQDLPRLRPRSRRKGGAVSASVRKVRQILSWLGRRFQEVVHGVRDAQDREYHHGPCGRKMFSQEPSTHAPADDDPHDLGAERKPSHTQRRWGGGVRSACRIRWC